MEYIEFFNKAKEKNITNIQVTEKHNTIIILIIFHIT